MSLPIPSQSLALAYSRTDPSQKYHSCPHHNSVCDFTPRNNCTQLALRIFSFTFVLNCSVGLFPLSENMELYKVLLHYTAVNYRPSLPRRGTNMQGNFILCPYLLMCASQHPSNAMLQMYDIWWIAISFKRSSGRNMTNPRLIILLQFIWSLSEGCSLPNAALSTPRFKPMIFLPTKTKHAPSLIKAHHGVSRLSTLQYLKTAYLTVSKELRSAPLSP